MMQIIDSHVHLGGPDRGDGASLSPEELIQRMDAAGVDRAVVFPFNEPGPDGSFSRANDFIASAVESYPERIIGFARLDPNRGEAALLELDRAIGGMELKGIKLHPKGQGFTPSNEHVLKIVERAAKFGVPVVFDNGKEVFDNHAIGRLAEKAPEARIIMAHMRGEGFIEVAAGHENLFLGTVKADVGDVRRAVEALGPERIIAGSDTPYADMAWEMRGKFREIEGLKEGELDMIRRGNILRLIRG
ncbi:MAG: hypothetical protein D6733_06080 [Methanobacteriota archaeon]|nr:MAG: hypothetical protein D6733_06080 [Euryarchaeota archaeon]